MWHNGRLADTMLHMAIAPNTLVTVPRRIPDNYVAINDAAAEIGVSVETLYRWIRDRRLRRMRVPDAQHVEVEQRFKF